MTDARRARLALLGLAAAMLAVHGTVGWLCPLQGDDWSFLLGSQPGLAGPLGDAVATLLARAAPWHAILSPVAGAALVLGTFTLGARRRPDPGRGRDVLGIALVSCMIWIALPRAGAMWFHRSYAAAQIYGGAVVAWFLVPFRCRCRLEGRVWPAVMGVAGLAAGATTRQLAIAAVTGAAVWLVRTPRPQRRRWMTVGLVGAAVGLVAGFVRSPWSELGRVFGRFEPNLVALGPLMRAGGPLILLTALLVLATLLRARSRPPPAGESPPAPGVPTAGEPATGESPAVLGVPAAGEPAAGEPPAVPAAPAAGGSGDAGEARAARATDSPESEPPDAGDALGWLAAWLGLGVAALLGPRGSEATQLPAALALCAGVLPILTWLAGVRFVRWTLVCLVAGVHLVAWTLALSTYGALGAEFRDRMAAIARTPVCQVATVRPYASLAPGFWSIGEDWADLGLRSTLARAWGLGGIELAPPFRQLERSPELALALEVDQVSDAELAAAAAPACWPHELAPARRTFAALVDRLRATTGRRVSARLRATGIEFPARRGRPVLAAWSEGAALVAPEVARSALDVTSRATISIPPSLAQLPEAWQVGPRGADAVRCAPGRCTIPVQRAERTILVLCDARRCVAADAWVPRF